MILNLSRKVAHAVEKHGAMWNKWSTRTYGHIIQRWFGFSGLVSNGCNHAATVRLFQDGWKVEILQKAGWAFFLSCSLLLYHVSLNFT